jgi:DNA-binding transcriptional MocR family regulator
MTSTQPLHSPAFSTLLSRDADETLIDQIARSVAARIDDKILRGGARMPSIRRFASEHGVSCFTVVASYDKLVARGYLESRRGAGFFVRERSPLNTGERSSAAAAGGAAQSTQAGQPLDVVWLIRNMFRQAPLQQAPGSGVLPADWLDGAAIANALRSVSRHSGAGLLNYGTPHGFLPLRQQLQLKLAEIEIEAAPAQLVTTVGVTQALDLVAREFTRPGDTIFVDDPAWFLMFGSFAALGVKVVGIPRLPDGPDLGQLAQLEIGRAHV